MSEKVSFVINLEGTAYRGVLQLDSAVKNIVDSVNAAQDGFKRIGNTSFYLDSIVNATNKIVQGFQAMTGNSLEFESQQRNLQTLLGGSAEKAQALTDRLRGFAKSTTYDSSTLIEAQKTMMSFGLDADFAYSKLKNIGDIAMGDKQKMQSLALAFAQTTSTGKLMGQDLLQMINAGFNPLQVISQKTGKSMGDLKEEMSKGAISADMVAQAFQWATEEGGLFYQGAEKAAETTAGKIAKMRGKIEDLQLKLFEATGGVTAYIGELGNMVAPLSALAPIFTDIWRGIKFCGIHWGGFVNGMKKTFLGIVFQLNSISISAGGAGGMLKLMGRAGVSACRAISAGIMSIPIIGWIAAGITAVIALFKVLWEKSENFRIGVFVIWEAVKSVWNMIVEVATVIWQTVKDIFTAVWGWINEKIIKPVKGVFKSVWEGIKGVFSGFFDWIGKKFDIVGKVLRKILPKGVFARGVAAGKASWENDHKEELGINDGLINAVNGGNGSGTGSGKTTEAGKSTEAIATGGTRNTEVHITIGDMIRQVTFNGTTAENKQEIERNFAECLYRVLGMAQVSV